MGIPRRCVTYIRLLALDQGDKEDVEEEDDGQGGEDKCRDGICATEGRLRGAQDGRGDDEMAYRAQPVDCVWSARIWRRTRWVWRYQVMRPPGTMNLSWRRVCRETVTRADIDVPELRREAPRKERLSRAAITSK